MTGVNVSILEEIHLFLGGFLMGAFLVVCYDIIRIFRRIIRHGILFISIEDGLYWISCALFMFAMLYQENKGQIRAFIFFAAAVGGLVYHLFIGKYFMRVMSKGILAIKKRLKKRWKVVTMFINNKWRIEVHRENKKKEKGS